MLLSKVRMAYPGVEPISAHIERKVEDNAIRALRDIAYEMGKWVVKGRPIKDFSAAINREIVTSAASGTAAPARKVRQVKSKHIPARKSLISHPSRVTPQKKLSASQIRAKAVASVIRELREIRSEMYNESYFDGLNKKYPDYLIFTISARHSRVKEWIANIQGRSDMVKLAQEIVAEHYSKRWWTIKTDWSHRRKPRKTALK
jgi:hypothetical protein